jgi:twitching motility protein PilI
MGNIVTNPSFEWLCDLDRRAKQRAKGLPRREKIQKIWRGIAFRLKDILLVTSLDDVNQVTNYKTDVTEIARVPGAKTWVKGLANVKGLLLPIIDLQACLGNSPIVTKSKTRLLSITQSGVSAGLLVDEVLGIKYFPEESRNNAPCKHKWIAPFAQGSFTLEGTTWIVFDMRILVRSDIFLKAAL